MKPMKIVIASDSFKGTLESRRIIEIATKAAKEAIPDAQCVGIPVADGGEGTVDAVMASVVRQNGEVYSPGAFARGEYVYAKVHDPLGNLVDARYCLITPALKPKAGASGVLQQALDAKPGQEPAWHGKTAVIEMAAASGLGLVPENLRNPLKTSTFGTGELIKDALDHGASDIYIGIGGSATNDGGIGCLAALGAVFKFQGTKPGPGFPTGESLIRLCDIDISNLDRRLYSTRITVLCDVTNPLCGPEGATYTFGPQKIGEIPDFTPAGAPVQIMQNTQIPQIPQSLQIPQNPQNLQNTQQPPDQRVSAILATLESGMQNYKSIILKNYGIDPDWIKGAGAAGGLGAALSLFLGGKMQSGIETVLDLAGFNEALENADLVITGEGRLDAQSLKGKVVSGVAKIAKKKGVPVAAICGSVDASDTLISKLGLKNVFTLVDEETPLNEALAKAEECYYKTALKLFYRSPYLL